MFAQNEAISQEDFQYFAINMDFLIPFKMDSCLKLVFWEFEKLKLYSNLSKMFAILRMVLL